MFVAVRAIPLSRSVAPLILEAHRDAAVRERPQFFHQPVIQFLRPLAAQEFLDCFAAAEELSAVAPFRIRRVRQCDALGIARIPGIFCGFNFGARGFECERWFDDWWWHNLSLFAFSFETGDFRFQFGDVLIQRRVQFADFFYRVTRCDVLWTVPVEGFNV